MINVNMTFNNATYENLANWIDNGTIDLQEGAIWLVAALTTIESTGAIKGNCVANKSPFRVWHIQEKPCSVLYRDRKPSILQLNLTIDRAIDGNHDWVQLGSSVLAEPNCP